MSKTCVICLHNIMGMTSSLLSVTVLSALEKLVPIYAAMFPCGCQGIGLDFNSIARWSISRT